MNKSLLLLLAISFSTECLASDAETCLDGDNYKNSLRNYNDCVEKNVDDFQQSNDPADVVATAVLHQCDFEYGQSIVQFNKCLGLNTTSDDVASEKEFLRNEILVKIIKQRTTR